MVNMPILLWKNATLIRYNLITGEKQKLHLMSINESMGVTQAKSYLEM